MNKRSSLSRCGTLAEDYPMVSITLLKGFIKQALDNIKKALLIHRLLHFLGDCRHWANLIFP